MRIPPPLKRHAPLAACAALVCLVYAPAFAGKVLFFRDQLRWSFPARQLIRDALDAGSWPLWNPFVGLGFAVPSDPLYGLFYPLNALYLLGPLANAVTLVSLLHAVLGGVGTAALARRFGAGGWGSLSAGVVWALSGYTTSLWTMGILLHAASWMPWCALGILHLLDRPGAGRAALAVVPCLLSLLTGELFLTLLVVPTACVIALIHARLDDGRPAPAALRPASLGHGIKWVGVTVAATLLLGAPSWWPAVRGLQQTARRGALPAEEAEAGSLHPLRLVELVGPGVFGDPFDDYPGELVVGEPRLYNRPLSDSVYLGAFAVGLALMALGRGRRRSLALAILFSALLVVALGRHTPVHGLLRRLVPPLAAMRYPEKYLILAVPCLAVLSGLGLRRMLEPGPATAGRRVALAISLPLLVVALACPWFVPAPVVRTMRAGTLLGAVIAGLLPILLLLARRRPGLGGGLAAAAVTLDLAAALIPLQRFTSPAWLRSVPPLAAAVRADGAAELAPPRVFRSSRLEAFLARTGGARPADVVALQSTATLAENTANVFGIATMTGYDAAVPSAFFELWRRGRQEHVAPLRLLSVRYAVYADDEAERRGAVAAGLEPLATAPGLATVYRVPGVLPRVYAASRAEVLDDVAARERVWAPDVLDGSTVVLAPPTQPSLPADSLPALSLSGCVLEQFEPLRLRARCALSRAGHAVFVEQYSQGWQAEVDGRAAPLLRANLVLRAVPVPAGEHTVELRFDPPGLRGAVRASLTGMGVLIVLAGGLLAARRRRARSG